MDTQAVNRRLNTLSAHLAPCEESVSAIHLFPLNCSSSLSSAFWRCDNRLLFARQASSEQSCFMRQASSEELDKRSRPQHDMPPKCSGSMMNNYGNASPLFSRPARVEPEASSISANQQLQQCNKQPSADLPRFARPDKSGSEKRQLGPGKMLYYPQYSGTQWSPRSDVAEFGRGYVMTVELPGVNINDIRVEINDENLIVYGQRSAIRQNMAGISTDSIFTYCKQEISQGPCKLSWPLPYNVNRDGVSAEFVDGLLRIFVPKL